MEGRSPKGRPRIMLELFLTYFTSMLFAFTGGNMAWPMVQHSLSERYRLMDKERSLEYYALGQSLPGVLTLNTAVMIGRELAGIAGAFAAAAGVILPAFAGMLFVAACYNLIMRFPVITKAVSGIRAGAVAIIASNAAEIIKRNSGAFDWIVLALVFGLILFLDVNILIAILLAGFLGAGRAWAGRKKPHIGEEP